MTTHEPTRSPEVRAAWMRGYAAALLEYRTDHGVTGGAEVPLDPVRRGFSLAAELLEAADRVSTGCGPAILSPWLLGYADALDAHGYVPRTPESLAVNLRHAVHYCERADAP